MDTDGRALGDAVVDGMVLVDGMPLGMLDMLGPDETLGFSLILEGLALGARLLLGVSLASADGFEDIEGKVETEGVLLGANSVEGDALTLGEDEG